MNKSCLAALAASLLWAGVAFGQDLEAPAPPSPDKAAGPPVAANAEDGAKPFCFWGPSATGSRVFSADVDYVLWFQANTRNDIPFAANPVGILAGQREKEKPVSGAHLALGYWQLCDNPYVPEGIRDVGAETVFFFVSQRSVGFTDNTSPNIVRPFFDVNNQRDTGFIVSFPGLATGAITGQAKSDLWGLETNVWKNVYYNSPGTNLAFSVMAGLRYLDSDAQFTIDSTSRFNQNLAAFPLFLPFAGNTLQVSDSFAAHNHFYGGQVGLSTKVWLYRNFSYEATAKLALGVNDEDLRIAGSQVRTLPDGTRIFSPAGLLALPSNSGHFHNDHFAQVPEFGFKVAAHVTDHLSFSTGFSALYWSRFLRPGAQVDRNLDITQIPNFPAAAGVAPTGLNQPGVSFRQSDLWVLGITFGLEVTY